MLNNFKLRQLEGFVLAADCESFTLAASRLAMTPPAFSQMIRELEQSLDLVLFERTTRRIALTEAGVQLLQRVRRPLDDLNQANTEMRALADGHRGRISFSILHSLAFGIGTRVLAAMQITHPDIFVKMIEDQNGVLIERVLNREVDFGVGMFTETIDGLSFEPLFEDALVAVFPSEHPYRHMAKVAWTDLAKSPLVLLPDKSSIRRLVDAGLTMTGAPRKIIHEVISMVTAVNMVQAGLGVTVLPALSLTSLRMDDLIHRPIGEPKPNRRIGLIRRANRVATAAEVVLIELIRAEAPEAPVNATPSIRVT